MKKIFINKWLEMKPYEKQVRSDIYYLGLSNRIKKVILTDNAFMRILDLITEEEVDDLSCIIASYFEDKLSNTKIWTTFIRLHHKLYEKFLPFFDTSEDYFEDDINPQDIAFLIWYYINCVNDEAFIRPTNEHFSLLGEDIFELLAADYETAPENETLKTYYRINPNETDFYVVRQVIDKLLFKTYLFYPDTGYRLHNKLVELIQNHQEEDDDILMYLNDLRDNFLSSKTTRLLSLYGKEWLAEILGEEHPCYADIKNISKKINGLFLYKGQDDENVSIEHIASGKQFLMTKESFDHYIMLRKIDTMLLLGIVRWQKKWWFSGVFTSTNFNADVVLDEKDSVESRKQVDFLDYDSKDTIEALAKQEKAFMKFNNQSYIAFMKLDEIQNFVASFISFYNQSLNLSKTEEKKAIQNIKDAGLLTPPNASLNIDESVTDFTDSGLVFFNPKSGLEVAFGINSAFPMDENSFFNPEESTNDLLFLMMNDSFSFELVHFCISRFKDRLPYFQDEYGEMVLENLDFLLRFWKKEGYYTHPSVSLIGQREK